MIKRIIILFSFLFLIPCLAQAQDWYFDIDSINGVQCSNTTGTGAIDKPYCSPYGKISGSPVWDEPAAGDTIYLRGGTYTGEQFKLYPSDLTKGTASAPITFRPYPGETVIFDGVNKSGLLFNFYGGIHDLQFIGPFEAKNYSQVAEGDATATERRGFLFQNWTIHDGSAGFYFRRFSDLTVDGVTCSNLKSVADHSLCIGVRGDSGFISDNISIKNIIAYDIYDGRSADERGDADGVWTDAYANNVSFENILVHDCEEDGVDTKAQNVTMRNVVTYNNGGSGIKLWGGQLGRTSNYSLVDVATYWNGETGIKCTGNGDTVIATINNATVYSNMEENIKNTNGNDSFRTCDLTVRNSILGSGGNNSILLATPYIGYEGGTDLSNVNITHVGGSSTPIVLDNCPAASGKYLMTQYTDGTFNSELTTGLNCVSPRGVHYGSATSPLSIDPLLVAAPGKLLFHSVATGEITSNTLTLQLSANLVWPNPVVGHYIEINTDGIRREITAVGDSGTPTISFTPAVSAAVCANTTACIGTKIYGWGTDGASSVTNLALSVESPVKEAGAYVEGVHCTNADDNGGSGMTGCVHWTGSAPEIGYTGTYAALVTGQRYRIKAVVND